MLIHILPMNTVIRLVTDFNFYVVLDHFSISEYFLLYVFFQDYTGYETKATAIN